MSDPKYHVYAQYDADGSETRPYDHPELRSITPAAHMPFNAPSTGYRSATNQFYDDNPFMTHVLPGPAYAQFIAPPPLIRPPPVSTPLYLPLNPNNQPSNIYPSDNHDIIGPPPDWRPQQPPSSEYAVSPPPVAPENTLPHPPASKAEQVTYKEDLQSIAPAPRPTKPAPRENSKPTPDHLQTAPAGSTASTSRALGLPPDYKKMETPTKVAHVQVEASPAQRKKYPYVAIDQSYKLGRKTTKKPWNYDKFDSTLWMKKFSDALDWMDSSPEMASNCLRMMRIHVLMDTIETFLRMQVPSPSFRRVYLETFLKETENLTSKFLEPGQIKEFTASKNTPPQLYITKEDMERKVRVIRSDCIDVGLECAKQKDFRNVSVLNMGNSQMRGGGYRSGAGAQEESIFRRTNMYYRLGEMGSARKLEAAVNTALKNNTASEPIDLLRFPFIRTNSEAFKPFPSPDATIYTPMAIVIRECEAKGYAFRKPAYLNFLTACAIDRSNKEKGLRYSADERTMMAKIIESILIRAHYEGNDCIVLGALGCGAFNNPKHEVAEIFRTVLFDRGFAAFFKLVIFAITEDANSEGQTAEIFEDLFKPASINDIAQVGKKKTPIW